MTATLRREGTYHNLKVEGAAFRALEIRRRSALATICLFQRHRERKFFVNEKQTEFKTEMKVE